MEQISDTKLHISVEKNRFFLTASFSEFLSKMLNICSNIFSLFFANVKLRKTNFIGKTTRCGV